MTARTQTAHTDCRGPLTQLGGPATGRVPAFMIARRAGTLLLDWGIATPQAQRANLSSPRGPERQGSARSRTARPVLDRSLPGQPGRSPFQLRRQTGESKMFALVFQQSLRIGITGRNQSQEHPAAADKTGPPPGLKTACRQSLAT